MSEFPRIEPVALAGLLVRFSDSMSEAANRAAIAFRSAVDQQNWPDVSETTTSLVSTFVLTDLVANDSEDLRKRLEGLLASRDWFSAALPSGRTLWHIPTVYGTNLAPQFEEAAELAGVDPDTAIKELSTSKVRVLTIGFAPGQPYLGELAENWNIPRQQGLTANVPGGALVVAIRQLVVFSAPTPTGWRHIGQTAFKTFRPTQKHPFPLKAGDELVFPSISRAEFDRITASDLAGEGGADREVLP